MTIADYFAIGVLIISATQLLRPLLASWFAAKV
jgi:hypothetical protein